MLQRAAERKRRASVGRMNRARGLAVAGHTPFEGTEWHGFALGLSVRALASPRRASRARPGWNRRWRIVLRARELILACAHQPEGQTSLWGRCKEDVALKRPKRVGGHSDSRTENGQIYGFIHRQIMAHKTYATRHGRQHFCSHVTVTDRTLYWIQYPRVARASFRQGRRCNNHHHRRGNRQARRARTDTAAPLITK